MANEWGPEAALNDRTPMRTSASLLGRLRLGVPGQDDWGDFTRRYGPMIHQWCRHWKLQEADAEDVTQEVLTRLASRLRAFEYDPSKSFRAYVKTVAHFAWCDLIDSRKKSGAGGSGDSAMIEQLQAIEARDDLQARLADAFDHEVLEEATGRVRLRVEPRTWDAFRLTAVEGLSGADAAARVEMSVAAVFKAKSKVQKMLREEVRRLEEGL